MMYLRRFLIAIATMADQTMSSGNSENNKQIKLRHSVESKDQFRPYEVIDCNEFRQLFCSKILTDVFSV